MTTGFTAHTQLSAIEKFKASYDKSGTGKPKRKIYNLGENTWKQRCQHYNQLCEQYPLLKMSLFTLAGLVTAQGIWFKPAVNKQDETYKLAEEAAYRTEKFKREQKVVSKTYETVFHMAKYGGCFWEITTDPVFSYRIPPLQECIEPAEADDQGIITRWRQVINNNVTAEWTNKELILIPFLGETTQTWPYAPSLLTGTETESEMLISVEESAKDYSEKQAWPYEVLQLGDGTAGSALVTDEEFTVARSEWKNRMPGEGLATRNMPVDIKAGGTGSAPIRELAVLCELMKKNINDAVMVPGVSQLYNATEASAKVLTAHVMTTLGQPIQWRVGEYFQDNVLKVWLESSGFSRKSCPDVVFESPDVHKKEEGEYWVSLVNAKIQSPVQAADHLGLEYDEAYWRELERKEEERFQQDMKAKQQSNDSEGAMVKGKFGESYLVKKVVTHD